MTDYRDLSGDMQGFGILLGPLGVFPATPLAAVCLVAVKQLRVHDALDEAVSPPGDSGMKVEQAT